MKKIKKVLYYKKNQYDYNKFLNDCLLIESSLDKYVCDVAKYTELETGIKYEFEYIKIKS